MNGGMEPSVSHHGHPYQSPSTPQQPHQMHLLHQKESLHQNHQQQHLGGAQPPHQQFCLKWNSFGSNLASSFSNLFKSETLADVTLFCDGVSFRAHKLILAACSKHLSDLFETAPLHQNLLVILDGTSSSNMAALLEFMYKGEVHVSQDALSSFLKAAECLQVKGLSIEHEKLAVAQSQNVMESNGAPTSNPSSSGGGRSRALTPNIVNALSSSASTPMNNNNSNNCSSGNSNKPHMIKMEADIPPQSPTYCNPQTPTSYMHHYSRSSYEQQQQATQRRGLRSPNNVQERPSVLRDCSSKTVCSSRPSSPGHMSLAYRPSSSASSIPLSEVDGSIDNNNIGSNRFDTDQPQTSLVGISDPPHNCTEDPGCPEDLRMKLEPTGGMLVVEPPSSTANTNNIGSSNGSANGTLGGVSSLASSVYNQLDDRKNKHQVPDGRTDLAGVTSGLWNSAQTKLSKTGGISTPDGKKLKCPFCERLYGYETNLRAHIRQRHQGIRVPCPFCSRTFTRNNTVRRHIAREHKTELSLKAFQQVHNP